MRAAVCSGSVALACRVHAAAHRIRLDMRKLIGHLRVCVRVGNVAFSGTNLSEHLR